VGCGGGGGGVFGWGVGWLTDREGTPISVYLRVEVFTGEFTGSEKGALLKFLLPGVSRGSSGKAGQFRGNALQLKRTAERGNESLRSSSKQKAKERLKTRAHSI